MKKEIPLRILNKKSLNIFKIKNRKGYAAICEGNLTEGLTLIQTYERMNKALKRMGLKLEELNSVELKKISK